MAAYLAVSQSAPRPHVTADGRQRRRDTESRTPEYRTWERMRWRCSDPNAPGFEQYGGRGVRVCARWRSYHAFLRDMGRRPSSAHVLGRTPGAKHYSPATCQWMTTRERAIGSANHLIVELAGRRMCLAEASRMTGMPFGTLRYRFKCGKRGRELFAPAQRRRNA